MGKQGKPLDDDFWKRVKLSDPYTKKVKREVRFRIDADVLAWFESLEGSYKELMASILREAMLKAAPKGDE